MHQTMRIISVLVALTLTLSILMVCVNAVEYPALSIWDLQNGNYFSFDKQMNFTETPTQGIANDSSLVGYWNINEGSGNIIYDSSGDKNNGTINGPAWVNGSYGSALSFNGVNDSVTIPNRPSLILKDQFTLSFQFSPTFISKNESRALVGKSSAYPNYEYYVYLEPDGRLRAGVHTNTDTPGDVTSNSSTRLVVGENYSIALTWLYPGQIKIYINGILQGSAAAHNNTITNTGNLTIGDLRAKRGSCTTGVFDNIRIYNRTLSEVEVAALYVQPDPMYSDNYYSYQDLASNNTMLILIDRSDLNSGNSTLVMCTDFFEDSRLLFTANNSVTVNLWSNLGRPVYTTGNWIDKNSTTALILNNSSTAELDWNPAKPPSPSNFTSNSTYAGNTTLTSIVWTDNRSLLGGGFIFSTNNSGAWVNSSWVPFSANPDWGNVTLVLNSKVGVDVSFREYANNTLGIWKDSGNYTIKTTVDYLPNPSATPTPSPSATAIPTATVRPTPEPSSTVNPNATLTPPPTPTSDTFTPNTITTQTILIVTAAVTAVLFVVFLFSFKKGLIKIEVLDEQDSEPPETQDDYQI